MYIKKRTFSFTREQGGRDWDTVMSLAQESPQICHDFRCRYMQMHSLMIWHIIYYLNFECAMCNLKCVQATTSLSHCWLWSCCNHGGDTVASEVFCFLHLFKRCNLWRLNKFLRLMQRTLGLTVEGRQVMTKNHIENVWTCRMNVKIYLWHSLS